MTSDEGLRDRKKLGIFFRNFFERRQVLFLVHLTVRRTSLVCPLLTGSARVDCDGPLDVANVWPLSSSPVFSWFSWDRLFPPEPASGRTFESWLHASQPSWRR